MRAEEALKPLIKKSRHDAEVLFLMALIAEAKRDIKHAREHGERSLKLRDHPDTLLLLARLERIVGETEKAVALCDRAERLRPGHPQTSIIKAGALEEGGRFDEARGIVEPLLDAAASKAQPSAAGVNFEWAKLLIHDKRYDDAITLLDELDHNARSKPELRRLQLHLKAKACDRNKDYAGAFDAAHDANEIGKLEFDPELYEEQVSTLIENWSAEAMAKFPVSGCDSEVPTFVAGMPRSGTSLIDQVIDAHPQAAGVGELSDIEAFAMQLSRVYDAEKTPPECFGKLQDHEFTRAAQKYLKHIRKISPPDTLRIVNKALGNNKLVGLLARLFPKTRIIHAMRDPRDVAVSCYMGGFNNALHAWTTQLDWVARAWEQSERMMSHWKQVLDVEILDVHYEALVADPEPQFRRIIDFIGLEWDDACLSFHKTRRTVRTLSYDQVNRPVYKSSSGRHANYAAYLDGAAFPDYQTPAS